MDSIELPQLGEGGFQRSPHPPERSGLLLDDLIGENIEGSVMKVEIAGHRSCLAAHGSHAQYLGLPIVALHPNSGGKAHIAERRTTPGKTNCPP
jgi:hypothetical protein